jgi:diguanylate cyclase (GGDEF)-like protein/PAS domain S-box-containing protein
MMGTMKSKAKKGRPATGKRTRSRPSRAKTAPTESKPPSAEPERNLVQETVGLNPGAFALADRQSVEQALANSELRYRRLFETAQDGILILDAETGAITDVNPYLIKMLGYTCEELLGKKLWEVGAFKDVEASKKAYLELQTQGYIRYEDLPLRTSDGQTMEVEFVSNVYPVGNQRVIQCNIRDIADRKRVERALIESEERYALATRGANDGLWDWNLKTNEFYYSPRWEAMLGSAEHLMENRPEEWFQRVHPEDVERLQADLAAHLAGHTAYFESEYRMLHPDGTYHWMLSRGVAVRDANGKAYRMAGSQTDIMRRKAIEEQLQRDVLHDALTGLPNRSLFMDRLDHAVARTKRRESAVYAVLFLDLDRFKGVNDSFGHEFGDEVLVAIAQQLQGCLRTGDTVARLGGDEFVILLDDIEDEGDAIRVAQRIQDALNRPFILNGREVSLSVSIGIALAGHEYDQPEALLRNADTAMYRAKASGKAHYEIFDPSMHSHAMGQLELESDLRRAVELHEFRLYYQPILTLERERVIGAEALVRWEHPRRGLVAPGEFIPAAEETGLILPLGEWVLRTACAQAQAWQAAGYLPLRIAVNVSARQFQEESLPMLIRQVLEDTGTAGQALEVEITESTAMQDLALSLRILNELRGMGIHISIDDFGSGYSSLGYLGRFPIQTLKIDRSFIRDVADHTDNGALTSAMIALGHRLNLSVIAEGVETEDELAFLQRQECDLMQGFWFSRPVPAEVFPGLLHA